MLKKGNKVYKPDNKKETGIILLVLETGLVKVLWGNGKQEYLQGDNLKCLPINISR